MPRCVPVLAAPALVVALALTGCASSDQSGAPEPQPASATGSLAPNPGPTPAPGSYVPTTAATVSPDDLPAGLRGLAALAGGDPAEAACINQGIAASLAPDADRPAARAGVAGTTVVQCLPPAKLAATLTDRLGAALGYKLTAGERSCIRATLVGSVADPTYTVFVGGVALGDAAVVRQGAGPIDAACATHLTAAD
jgi:hypothetical protein